MKDVDPSKFAGPAKDKRLAGFVWRVHRYLEEEGQSPGLSLYDDANSAEYAYGFVRTRQRSRSGKYRERLPESNTVGHYEIWGRAGIKSSDGKEPSISASMALVERIVASRIASVGSSTEFVKLKRSDIR